MNTLTRLRILACFPPPVPAMRRPASLHRVRKDTVPRLPRYHQGATTPDSASHGLSVFAIRYRALPQGSCSRSRAPRAGAGTRVGPWCGWVTLAVPVQRFRTRAKPGLPGSLALHRQPCSVPATPADPVRLANSGGSGAAPAALKTKAPTATISTLKSTASLPTVYASRRTLPYAMQHSLPAGRLALTGWEFHPLDCDARLPFLQSPPFL